MTIKVGVLSDSHGLLRPQVAAILKTCDCAIHAGDVDDQAILDELRALVPLRVVRGNNDKDWAEHLPLFLDFELAGLRVYMTHKKKDLPKDLSAYDLVIYGHSHQYAEAWLPLAAGRRTLLLNPGSCGPRRFHQPVTMAVMEIADDGWQVKRIEIPHAPREAAPKIESADVRRQIEIVVRETQKGQTVSAIAQKHGLDAGLVEQIARLFVTHPGVTVDGIMTKMGI